MAKPCFITLLQQQNSTIAPFLLLLLPFSGLLCKPPPPPPPPSCTISFLADTCHRYHIIFLFKINLTLFIFYIIIHHKYIASYLRIFCTSLQVNVTKCSLRGGEPATKKRVENCPIVVSQTSVLIKCNDDYIHDD